MATGQNVNLRIPDELLQRIDANATKAGLSRTQYVLSWLPETHDSNRKTEPDDTQQERRSRT